MTTDENKNNKAEEPQADYGAAAQNKTIRFFSSLEEMNEYDYRLAASRTPEESLAIVTQMRLLEHPHLSENLHPWGNVIYFD